MSLRPLSSHGHSSLGAEACTAFVQSNAWAAHFVSNQNFVQTRAALVPSKTVNHSANGFLSALDSQSQRIWNRYWSASTSTFRMTFVKSGSDESEERQPTIFTIFKIELRPLMSACSALNSKKLYFYESGMIGLRALWGAAGGVETAVSELAPRLARLGAELSVLLSCSVQSAWRGEHEGVQLVNHGTIYTKHLEPLCIRRWLCRLQLPSPISFTFMRQVPH